MKMITTILLIVCCMFLLGSLVYFSGNNPMLEGGIKEIITRVYAGKGITTSNGAISIMSYDTVYTKEYKVLKKTGNESLYDVTFTKKGKNTTICLEAGWDSKQYVTYRYNSTISNYTIDKNYTYSVPSSLAFYKSDSLTKQADLVKNKTNMLSATSPLNPNKFCYQANPEQDFYLKFGENSVTVIQNTDVITDSLLSNITAETNFTHLNISENPPYDNLTGYWSFDGDLVNINGTTHYDFAGNYDGTGIGNAVVNSSNCMGDFGNCLQLDGTGDYVDAGDIDELDGTSAFTISAWMRRAGTNEDVPITKATDGDNRIGLSFSSNKAFFTVSNGAEAEGSFVLDDANWHHLAIVFNGSASGNANRVKGFTDGVVRTLDFGATTIPATTATMTGNVQIGALTIFSVYGNGSIDEVMIFNTSLTATQISNIFNNQSARFVTEGTQKVRAVKITDGNTWDNAGNNSVNLTLDFQANKNSNISARIGQINLSVNNSGLVLYMPFEWGSAVDISGEGNDGTINGNAFINESGLNDTLGLQLDGNGDYINTSDIDFPNAPFSISSWFKTNSSTSSMGLFFKGVDNANFNYIIYINDGVGEGNVWSGVIDGVGVRVTSSSSSDYTDNNWHHIVLRVNTTAVGLFLDSSFISSITHDNNLYTDNNNALIGNFVTGAYFNGSIDEFMIFNRSLSPTEISALYKNQSGAKNIAYYTDYQNITGNPTNFTINTEADFVFPDFKFHSGDDQFYTPILNGSITLETWNFSAAVAAVTCDCPSSGNWEISDGSICKPSSDCNIGTNNLRINSGGLLIDSGINVRTGGCYVSDGQRLFVDKNGGLFCGN